MSKWKIDPTHSSVTFKVKHMGISWARGQFYDISGEIEYDPENISSAQFMGIVKPDSVSTGLGQRDSHLKSPDFFDVENYPEIKFETIDVTKTGDNTATVAGNLTIKDITKQVELDIQFHGVQEGLPSEEGKKEIAAFSGTTKIDRTDFGLNWNLDIPGGKKILGNVIELTLEAEAIKQ